MANHIPLPRNRLVLANQGSSWLVGNPSITRLLEELPVNQEQSGRSASEMPDFSGCWFRAAIHTYSDGVC